MVVPGPTFGRIKGVKPTFIIVVALLALGLAYWWVFYGSAQRWCHLDLSEGVYQNVLTGQQKQRCGDPGWGWKLVGEVNTGPSMKGGGR